jgi:hypothetical protein
VYSVPHRVVFFRHILEVAAFHAFILYLHYKQEEVRDSIYILGLLRMLFITISFHSRLVVGYSV